MCVHTYICILYVCVGVNICTLNRVVFIIIIFSVEISLRTNNVCLPACLSRLAGWLADLPVCQIQYLPKCCFFFLFFFACSSSFRKFNTLENSCTLPFFGFHGYYNFQQPTWQQQQNIERQRQEIMHDHGILKGRGCVKIESNWKYLLFFFRKFNIFWKYFKKQLRRSIFFKQTKIY